MCMKARKQLFKADVVNKNTKQRWNKTVKYDKYIYTR